MGDYVPNVVLLFHKLDIEEKRRKIMENLKVGDIKTITVEVDAIMTGLNSGSRVRVMLPSGEKVWLNSEMLEEE